MIINADAKADELLAAKFGVETDEFDDGIIIYGKPIESLKEGATVHCYEDHRVGMAFAVLSAVAPQTIIEEKRCVEKTWPNFWDDLQNQIGLAVNGVDIEPQASTSTIPTIDREPSHPIFLIGMRGAGKTYIGRLAAEALGGEYTDADEVFATHTQLSVSQFVEKNGWQAFRDTELEILQNFAKEKRGNHVVALGGGVVETPAARDLLKAHIKSGGHVVHITREMEDIEGFLDSIGSTAARPHWGEGFAEVFKRRQPWFQECSSHEFFNTLSPVGGQSQTDHERAMREECARFFNFISGIRSNRSSLSANTYTSFLSLTFPDITPALQNMDELTEGADAVELRVDLLSTTGQAQSSPTLPPTSYVAKQLSMLRLSTDLPIVFSVRSKDQGGMVPSNNPAGYTELLELGIRAGCEYVDLEVCWPASVLDSITKSKSQSQIVASWHDWTGKMAWNSKALKEKYELCSKYGDVIKLVGMANSISDNLALSTFAEGHRGPGKKPLLAINMGAKGQMSRVLNPTLTPVTHPLLPSRAAPGQLSVKEINIARNLLGIIPSKRFFLFGSPISASVSPTLHNTGFEALGLPYAYDKHESSQADQGVLDIISSPDFGGASVTIPLKLDIIPHLAKVSNDAKVIGAVNTIVPMVVEGKVELHGENTDWLAIKDAILSNLPPSSSSSSSALVIGAGGTCRAAIYALANLPGPSRPSTIYLFNRTASKADDVAKSFPNYAIKTITSLDSLPSQPNIIISTVPGDSLSVPSASPVEGSSITLPASLFKDQGVAIDLAYKPHKTALIQSAEGKAWKAVTGIEILLLQGYRQFELWAGKRAPKKRIQDAVLAKYHATI